MHRLVLALLAPVTSWAFDPATVDSAALGQLASGGQFVVVEREDDGRLRLVTGGALVPAPPEDVWTLITDYERYPEWVPQTTETQVVRDDGQVKEVSLRLDFRFSIAKKTLRYVLRYHEHPPSRVDFSLVEGDLSQAEGSWQIVPTDGGSLVFYSTLTDLESMGWIVKSLIAEQPSMDLAIQASTALMVVEAVEEQLVAAE